MSEVKYQTDYYIGQEVLVLRGIGKIKRWRKGFVYVGYTMNSSRYKQGNHILVRRKDCSDKAHLYLCPDSVKPRKGSEHD